MHTQRTVATTNIKKCALPSTPEADMDKKRLILRAADGCCGECHQEVSIYYMCLACVACGLRINVHVRTTNVCACMHAYCIHTYSQYPMQIDGDMYYVFSFMHMAFIHICMFYLVCFCMPSLYFCNVINTNTHRFHGKENIRHGVRALSERKGRVLAARYAGGW